MKPASAAPLLSVIIPAHNAAATLPETLACLRRQTIGDWEAIVVDDGSSDGTPDILAAASASDPRIRPLRRDRDGNSQVGGVSATRNAGLAQARADWVTFLDADDWVAPRFIERMRRRLRARPDADLVYCGFRRVLPDGVELSEQPGMKMNFARELAQAPFGLLARRCPLAIHAVMVRRRLVLEAGGFDPDLSVHEDWDLWLRVARMGAVFAGEPSALAFYRVRADSATTDTARMAREAGRVLARARQPDPRPAGTDPRHRDGLLGDDGAVASAHVTLYLAGVAAGAGQAPGAVLAAQERWPRFADHDSRLGAAGAIAGGLALGAQKSHERLIESWDAVAPRVAEICACIGAATGDGIAAPACLAAVEMMLLAAAPLDQPRALHTVHGFRVALDQPLPELVPAPHVDGIYVRVTLGSLIVGEILAATAFPLAPRELARMLLASWGVPALAYRLARTVPGARGRFRSLHDLPWARPVGGVRRLAARLARARFTPMLLAMARRPPERRAPLDRGQFARLVSTWRRAVLAAGPTSPATALASPPTGAPPGERESAYQRRRRERTLALIPGGSLARALAIGAGAPLAAALAARAQELIAADDPAQALARASADVAGGMAVIVCCDALDRHCHDRDSLRDTAARLAGALAPGGHLIASHELALADDSGRSGFDGDRPFGADAIDQALGATPGLVRERSLVTELYRVDRYRRLAGAPAQEAGASAGPPAVVSLVPLDGLLEPARERRVVWGGASLRRCEAAARRTTARVPVLMYHRIADQGPAALARWRLAPYLFEQQLRWLRQHGYHAISSVELRASLQSGTPLGGRPILLTFDDGYRDFLHTAWPLLARHDFRPELFVVTDKVGATADWDSRHGPPAPLLTWREIAELHHQGVFIGSHLATHRPASALSMDQLVEEAARSRFTLEARLQTPVRSVAMPFGDWDQRLIAALVWSGYEIGFSVEDGVASGGRPLFTLPRIEVKGGEDLSAFARKLERALEDPAPPQQRIAVTASRDAAGGDTGRAAPPALAFEPGLPSLAGGTARAESGRHE